MWSASHSWYIGGQPSPPVRPRPVLRCRTGHPRQPLSDDGLHPCDAVQTVDVRRVGARTAPDQVGLAIVGPDVVAAVLTEELVFSGAATDGVTVLPTADDVRACGAGHRVAADPTFDPVVPGAAVHLVGAGSTQDRVPAVATGDLVELGAA